LVKSGGCDGEWGNWISVIFFGAEDPGGIVAAGSEIGGMPP
jgi:hypothetical protein